MKLIESFPYVVKGGDTVIFHTMDGESICYNVINEWLHCYDDPSNDAIFNMLGIMNVEEMVSNAYGYPITYQQKYWPPYKPYDFEAASRLITEIAKHCKGVEIY